MIDLIEAIRRDIKGKAEEAEKAIVSGECQTLEAYKARAAQRHAYLKAIDIVTERFKAWNQQ